MRDISISTGKHMLDWNEISRSTALPTSVHGSSGFSLYSCFGLPMRITRPCRRCGWMGFSACRIGRTRWRNLPKSGKNMCFSYASSFTITGHWEIYSLVQGTLLLNGSVGFLAIQTIDDRGSYRSGAEIASYLSIVASIGCIILGLLLLHQNRQSASTYNALVSLSVSFPTSVIFWQFLAILLE